MHQNVCIGTNLAQDNENLRSKSMGKIKGSKLDFSDGVAHKVFIYQPNAPKLHHKLSIDTSLAKDKENSRLRSKFKVKGQGK